MIEIISDLPASSLRQRMIDEKNMRRLARKTQIDYVRYVERFVYFLGRPPDTATPEDLRQLQIDQRNAGVNLLGFLMTDCQTARKRDPLSASKRMQ